MNETKSTAAKLAGRIAAYDGSKAKDTASSGEEKKPEVKPEEKAPANPGEEKLPPKQPEGAAQQPAQKPAEPKKPAGISVFDDLKKSTEEDKDQKSRMEQAAELMDANEEIPDEPIDPDAEDDPRVKRETNKITAAVIVELVDVVFMFACMWASGDWSEAAQIKYTLPKPRKTAIQIPLYQLLNRRKKKTNPLGSLIFLALGSYAPMLVLAIMAGMKKKRGAQEEENKVKQLETQLANSQAQAANLQQQMQQWNAQRQFNAANPGFNNPPVGPPPPAPFVNPGANAKAAGGKKARGRHLHWCNAKNGGACNCAGYIHKPKCPANHGKKCTCYK